MLHDKSTNAAGEVEKCARCGKCRAVCPVFAELKDEAYVARGRVRLLEALHRGELSASAELQRIMSACLMCQRCSEICPSGVDFIEVIRAARGRLATEAGLPFGAAFVFRHIITRRLFFDLVMRAVSVGQRLIPGKRNGNLRHLPLFFRGGKWLPPMANVPALRRFRAPTKIPVAAKRAGIFVGCLTNYVYPHIVERASELLAKANVETIVPTSQLCCGTPPLAFGDIEAAKNLAEQNMRCFESAKCDVILTVCASCGRTLEHEYPFLLGRGASPFGVPVMDICEFLCEHANLQFDRTSASVTYHDPCHLRWGQGIYRQPRELLKRACHFEEISGEMYCCGMAGTFHVFFPEIAHMIGRRKVESLVGLDATEIATGCPGCILQLNDLLAAGGLDKRAVHTVEILARAATKESRNENLCASSELT